MGFAERDKLASWSQRCTEAPRFTLGLGPERQALVEALKQASGKSIEFDPDAPSEARNTAVRELRAKLGPTQKKMP